MGINASVCLPCHLEGFFRSFQAFKSGPLLSWVCGTSTLFFVSCDVLELTFWRRVFAICKVHRVFSYVRISISFFFRLPVVGRFARRSFLLAQKRSRWSATGCVFAVLFCRLFFEHLVCTWPFK